MQQYTNVTMSPQHAKKKLISTFKIRQLRQFRIRSLTKRLNQIISVDTLGIYVLQSLTNVSRQNKKEATVSKTTFY